MERVVKSFHLTYKFDAVLPVGRSEEILGDQAVRQAMKNLPEAM
jgi:hypothetical protein